MMPVIRIPDRVFERLQAMATPLVDSPRSVIEKLLDFYERQAGKAASNEPKQLKANAPSPDKSRRHARLPKSLSERRLKHGPKGSVEQEEFFDLIISSIVALGGEPRRPAVIDFIRSVWGHQFQQADFALLRSQTPPKERWIHNVDWAKRKLVTQLLLCDPDSAPRGAWILTDKGKRTAQELGCEEAQP